MSIGERTPDAARGACYDRVLRGDPGDEQGPALRLAGGRQYVDQTLDRFAQQLLRDHGEILF
jgi:hypothetical protein